MISRQRKNNCLRRTSIEHYHRQKPGRSPGKNSSKNNYYLIHTTYTTKLEKKYPETKGTLNNVNIIYVLSTVQKNKLKRQTNNKS